MKKALNIILLFVSINTIQAQTFSLNNNTSELSWTGKAAFNSYSLTGTLTSEQGSIMINDNTIESLVVNVDMKSLDHQNKRLKTHLRGKDFFEVKKYNTATFTLKDPIEIVNGEAELTGTFTIKGTSHQEKMKATIVIEENKVTLSFDTEIDRTKYGVKFNSPSFFKKMKENAIADLFILKGKLHFQ